MSPNVTDRNSIPNLLSLRGTRAGRSGRFRGRGGRPAGPNPDQAIQGTDDDAAGSRLSAVCVGYLDDPFAQYFVDSGLGSPPRRLPIINRGTYTRTCALDRLIGSFLSGETPSSSDESSKRRQLVSLGAGTDTRIFRLFAKTSSSNLVYHEIDFPATVAKKKKLVQSNYALRHIMGDPSFGDDGEGSWSCEPPKGGQYYCHSLDLRELSQRDASSIAGLRTDVPTLVLSECCLCYLETPVAKGTLNWFTHRMSDIAVVIYEPVRANDAFGKMMVSNLAARQIRMPTVQDYETPKDQERRLRDAGLEQANALTIEDVWKRWISSEEKERVDQLEGLDEVEEWQLLADHYVVTWGRKGTGYGLWDPEGDRM